MRLRFFRRSQLYLSAVDNDEITGVTLLDLSAASDAINHTIHHLLLLLLHVLLLLRRLVGHWLGICPARGVGYDLDHVFRIVPRLSVLRSVIFN